MYDFVTFLKEVPIFVRADFLIRVTVFPIVWLIPNLPIFWFKFWKVQALCGAGEDPLGTGFIFTEPGNREVSFLRAAPFLSPSSPGGVSGAIASNSGGTARAQVMAICLGA